MKNVALITGASGGIGLELARIHAQTHGDLVLIARSTSKLEELKKELEAAYGISVLNIPKDLSIPDAGQEVYDQVMEAGIQVDYLINNAGFGDFGNYHETDWEKEEMMINLNILALTQLTKLFGSDMVGRKSGRIMNVSSTAAFQPGPLMSVYYATKHYVQAYSEALYEEWKAYGVSVTALCPGATQSGFQLAADMEDSKLFKGKQLPTSLKVAEFGYKAMMKGEMTAIHGVMNTLLAGSAKFTPKKLLLKVVRKLQEKTQS
ncbi:SDR family NAD(P)-dependent oxidoreductase [Marinoscillum sp.]|uniref:SDR family NAD(P)-dependent oxidoreductase n=1 Tax=Marinoscillum sp. TaxID=2024838 RepID=UPI003BAA395C